MECPSSSLCNHVCAQNRVNRSIILNARADREAVIARKAENLEHLLDHPEVELPPHVQAAEATNFTQMADASNRLNNVESNFDVTVERLGAFAANEACDICPVRQLDVSPLPPQE